MLEAMKPDPAVSDPPEISRLRMVRHAMGLMAGPPAGHISTTDKSLVLLYAGFYQPGSSTCPSSGCYLVYDASTNSLTATPQLPSDKGTFQALGRGAAILSRVEGRYDVAEFVAGENGFPDAALFLWRQCPNNLTPDRWIRKAVRLPLQVFVPGYSFNLDVTFSYAGSSSVCWVDLRKGVVICDMDDVESSAADQPEFTFVPLPEGYSLDTPVDRRKPQPWPKEFRTMGCGCANGGSVIKFVAVAGYGEPCNVADLVLRTWTLTPDSKRWEEGAPLPVRDLWASESIRARSLPQLAPSHPVISTDEEDVVYVVLNEFDRVLARDNYGESFVQIVRKAQHVLRLDMVQKKVLHSTKIVTDDTTPIFTDLIASEFAAYLQGSN